MEEKRNQEEEVYIRQCGFCYKHPEKPVSKSFGSSKGGISYCDYECFKNGALSTNLETLVEYLEELAFRVKEVEKATKNATNGWDFLSMLIWLGVIGIFILSISKR